MKEPKPFRMRRTVCCRTAELGRQVVDAIVADGRSCRDAAVLGRKSAEVADERDIIETVELASQTVRKQGLFPTIAMDGR